MKKAQLLLSCLALLMISAATISAQKQVESLTTETSIWLGEYKYDYSEGKTAGDASTLIEYTIIVSKKGDALTARFTVDGYQSSGDYECRTEVQGNKLNLYVVRDLVDRDGFVMANAVKKGQLLASLVKTTVRGKTVYLFKNGKYEIYPNNIAAKYPVYFKKKN